MGSIVAVGGPNLAVGPGGWDLWPLAGLLLALWVGRRFLRMPWGAPLLIGALVASLLTPILVHAWGVGATIALAAALVVTLRNARGGGSPGTNPSV